MMVQMAVRARKRQGRRCEVMNKRHVATKRMRKILELKDSLLKFVDGVTPAMSASCAVEKSSMLFWRSRMLRKKSLDISEAGRMVRAGASGGP